MSRSVKEWIGKTDDTPVPPRVRLRVFAAKGGRCHKCTRLIRAGEKWTCEHVIAIINLGPNRENNLALTCRDCLPEKNAADVAEKSKVATIRKKHLGLKKPKHPFPKRVAPWGTRRVWRMRCLDCQMDWAEWPSQICPGCEAYREHTGAI